MRSFFITRWITVLVVLAGAVPLRAQQLGAGTRIVASRRTVEVIFPRAPAPGGESSTWSVGGPAIHAEWNLILVASPAKSAASAASLSAVVASAQLLWCNVPGPWQSRCAPIKARAFVRQGHVVLRITDSAAIAEMFGLRPRYRQVTRYGSAEQVRLDSALVMYIAPQIPAPSDSLRAWAAERQRLDRKNATWIERRLAGPGDPSRRDTIWVSAGDTIELAAEEYECSGDTCFGGALSAKAARWTISDPSVLEIMTVAADTNLIGTRSHWIAKRAGVATVRIDDLPEYDDTAHVRTPPPRTLSRIIGVRPR